MSHSDSLESVPVQSWVVDRFPHFLAFGPVPRCRQFRSNVCPFSLVIMSHLRVHLSSIVDVATRPLDRPSRAYSPRPTNRPTNRPTDQESIRVSCVASFRPSIGEGFEFEKSPNVLIKPVRRRVRAQTMRPLIASTRKHKHIKSDLILGDTSKVFFYWGSVYMARTTIIYHSKQEMMRRIARARTFE